MHAVAYIQICQRPLETKFMFSEFLMIIPFLQIVTNPPEENLIIIIIIIMIATITNPEDRNLKSNARCSIFKFVSVRWRKDLCFRDFWWLLKLPKYIVSTLSFQTDRHYLIGA